MAKRKYLAVVTRDDRVPPEIAAIRKRRDRQHAVIGAVLLFTWFAMFIVGQDIHSWALTWLAFIMSFGSNAAMYYEQILRNAAGRPRADYNRIWKLEKKLNVPRAQRTAVKG